MALKLMVESNFQNQEVQYDYLIESLDKGGKSYHIQGPFIQTNVANRNRRVYPRELMESVVADYKKDRLDPTKGIRSYGELGHPDGVEINPDRISHFTKSLDWHGDNCIGNAEILDTPMGRICMTILEKGLRLATSTRGLGALSESPTNDGARMVETYEMIASDIVIDPSAPQGFVEGILENKEFIIKNEGNNRIVECYDLLEAKMYTLPRKSKDRKEHFGSALEKFLRDL